VIVSILHLTGPPACGLSLHAGVRWVTGRFGW